MKPTKTQIKELSNCHAGVGTILINMGDGTIRNFDIRLGITGYWYSDDGQQLINKLDSISSEIWRTQNDNSHKT